MERLSDENKRVKELEEKLRNTELEIETDKQLSEWLHISRCTLREHRNAGLIPFHTLGGKILYKESEIDRLLKDNSFEVIP